MSYERGRYDDERRPGRARRDDAGHSRPRGQRDGMRSSDYDRSSYARDRRATQRPTQGDERHAQQRRTREPLPQRQHAPEPPAGERRDRRRDAGPGAGQYSRFSQRYATRGEAARPAPDGRRVRQERDARPTRPDGARRQHASQPRRSPGAGAPARAERYSRERYVAQQGVQRGASAVPSRQAQARRAKPVNPRTLLILAAVAAVLLAVIIVRFIAFGGTASEYGAVKAQIDEQSAQMAQLEESSASLQEQIDSMQPLIDQYNATKK